MALTELEQRLIDSLQTSQQEQSKIILDLQRQAQQSQQEQTKIIEVLQEQVEDLSRHVESLSDAYSNLYKFFNGEENDL